VETALIVLGVMVAWFAVSTTIGLIVGPVLHRMTGNYTYEVASERGSLRLEAATPEVLDALVASTSTARTFIVEGCFDDTDLFPSRVAKA
jgi:hypothetical protein